MSCLLKSRVTRCLVVASTLLATAGCINVGIGGSEPTPDIRFHVLSAPTPVASTLEVLPVTISVRELNVRGRYEARVVESDGADTLRFREFERWADEPDEALTVAVRESLVTHGHFEAVLSAGTGLRADFELNGDVLAFDLIRPTEGPLRARFVARMFLSDAGSGQLEQTTLISGEAPLVGRDATGLGTAMGTAVDRAISELLAKWKAAGAWN